MKEITYPNMIVRIHRPELTPEERAKRMQAIHEAAAKLLMKGAKPNVY